MTIDDWSDEPTLPDVTAVFAPSGELLREASGPHRSCVVSNDPRRHAPCGAPSCIVCGGRRCAGT